MGKWVSLKEALMSQSLQHEYGDLTKRQIDYVPALKSVRLTKIYTGVEEVQTFSTEKNHTWYPFIHEGEVYLIAGEVTKAKLRLRGKEGYENGINSLKKIAWLYGKGTLGVKGIGFTREIFSDLPKHLRNIKGSYWISEKCENVRQLLFGKALHTFGLQYVLSGFVYDTDLCDSDYITPGSYYHDDAVRPLVHLQSNTEVYIDGSDGPLKIRIISNGKMKTARMERWVSLGKALMYPYSRIYGDLTKRQINYVPDPRSVRLTKADTGWHEVQTFSTEKNHTWYPFIYAGEVYLIAGEVTEAKLWLRGEGGYENGINSLKKIAWLYGKGSLRVKGIELTREIFSALPKHLRDIKGEYWLPEKFELKEYSYCSFGLQYVLSGFVSGYGLCDSHGSTNYNYYATLPLVHLGSNTEVYIDGSDGPLEIRISPNAEEAQEKEEILPNEAVYSISKKELVRLRLHATNVVKIAVANEDQDAYTEAKGLLNLIEQIEKGK